MKKETFKKSVLIKTDIEALFRFHLDTNNLNKISPPGIKTDIIHISEVPLRKDSTVEIKLSKLGLSRIWKIKIAEYDPPYLVSDLQTSGIFYYWHHYHIFDPKENGVLMTDKIEYIPPFGPLGRLGNPVIKIQLNRMFSYRHSRTREIFEKS
jgi:ligand-binding SRPBCC domain-containing protein